MLFQLGLSIHLSLSLCLSNLNSNSISNTNRTRKIYLDFRSKSAVFNTENVENEKRTVISVNSAAAGLFIIVSQNAFISCLSLYIKRVEAEAEEKQSNHKSICSKIDFHFHAMANIGLLTIWFNKKIVEPLLEILRRGAEPKLLAFSAAVGFTIGLFPICGTTVILCGLAITSLGSHCHAPTVMVINLMATPVELSLVVPFLRFGEYISGGPHFPLTSDAMKKVLTLQASNEVLLSIAHALLGWLIASPLIFAAVYTLFFPLFKVLVHKFSTVPLSPKRPLSPPEVRLKVEGQMIKEQCPPILC